MSGVEIGTSTERAASTAPRSGVAARLTFGGLLHAEWIKLWTLRSTYWCFLIAVALTVGFGFLVAVAISSTGLGDTGSRPGATSALAQAATGGTSIAELVVAVLGALIVTGEYGTGMIRTTFLAAPRRFDALGAKALVFVLVAFGVGIVAVAISTGIAIAVVTGAGLHPDLGQPGLWGALLGGAGALALVGLLAVGIGMLVRNSAFAITLSVGILFVLPIIMSILSGVTRAHWVTDLIAYLPSQAASTMSSYVPHGLTSSLDPWQAALVLGLWAGVFVGLGVLAAERRDA
ncbi:ABC transporter permease subunit [Curtobacterium sp. MCBD17_028]|uniref:ABC transporter permease subunit n=1 Tax=Curtobacterium sp. MCBD17_028 TaxID=2175670 RepID=UPI000DA98071|nr:ABC transporter permease subunit [Curtobacterium sp. MCBD17_028]PZE23115.1 ABC transporter permease [Curtobacterium sp. MCBD17_028]